MGWGGVGFWGGGGLRPLIMEVYTVTHGVWAFRCVREEAEIFEMRSSAAWHRF